MKTLLRGSWYHSFMRKIAWRIGRRLYAWARDDISLPAGRNGEYALLDCFLSTVNRPCALFDIGANKGEWSLKALTLAEIHHKSPTLHLFEPSLGAHKALVEKTIFKSVRINQQAVSNKSGDAKFFIRGALSGTNSLYPEVETDMQHVSTITFDDYIENYCNLEQISVFVKSDTEGHDYHVLEGAEKVLSQGGVAIWQFEYNHRWVAARCFLKDVFGFIKNKPYFLGKLSAHGIEIYSTWHPELERFFESNFVLIRKDYVPTLPSVSASVFSTCNTPTIELDRCALF